MSCSSCSTGVENGTPKGCKNNGTCGTDGCNKHTVFDWLANMSLPNGQEKCPWVEVRFKNSRKEFYFNKNNFDLKVGDLVAVSAKSGHDIGMVTITGELVNIQMRSKKASQDPAQAHIIYRLATQKDIDIWQKHRDKEYEIMHKARTLALNLRLEMKISDVEFQGDGNKATFYYTADGRVDFRELIKSMASSFNTRIEMKQIGYRQEAARLGGIGSCGRELCCSTWLTDFRSVNTAAARYQQLSINPQKLAGQCGKLKCCLNYELDAYLEAIGDFPSPDIVLKTEKGIAFFQKMDIFKRKVWYNYKESPITWVELDVDEVSQIIATNKKGKKVESLEMYQIEETPAVNTTTFGGIEEERLDRFDSKTKRRPKKKRPQRSNKKKPNQASNTDKKPVSGENKNKRPNNRPKRNNKKFKKKENE